MKHQLTNNEVAEVERKLSLPVGRDENGKLVPTKFTDRELNFLVFVRLQKLLYYVRLDRIKLILISRTCPRAFL